MLHFPLSLKEPVNGYTVSGSQMWGERQVRPDYRLPTTDYKTANALYHFHPYSATMNKKEGLP